MSGAWPACSPSFDHGAPTPAVLLQPLHSWRAHSRGFVPAFSQVARSLPRFRSCGFASRNSGASPPYLAPAFPPASNTLLRGAARVLPWPHIVSTARLAGRSTGQFIIIPRSTRNDRPYLGLVFTSIKVGLSFENLKCYQEAEGK